MKAQCPCCKGKKFLVVFDSAWPGREPGRYEEICTHCMGTGEVEIEIEVDDATQ